MENTRIIEKLWDNEALENGEIMHIISALRNFSGEEEEKFPYNHERDSVIEAIGFENDRHYKIFTIEQNAEMAKSLLSVGKTSQAIEFLEGKFLSNSLARRAVLFSLIGKPRMSRDDD